jgi:hypothetical protein
MCSELDLAAIKARLAATTPGDWTWADEVGDTPMSMRRGTTARSSPLETMAHLESLASTLRFLLTTTQAY